MKRFTNTEKWADPWFRKLSPLAKLLWSWLVDHVDNAGVVDPDDDMATFQIGSKIESSHFTELGDRIKKLPNGKVWIPKFVKFQFGELSQTSKVHQSVIRLLANHGIDYAIPLESDRNENLIGALSTKEKATDKEKEKEKEVVAWIAELQASPAYKSINVRLEFEKAAQWIKQNRGRKLSRRFIINWLNRIEVPINGHEALAQTETKLNGAEKVVLGREYERVIERMKSLRQTYGDHQTWSINDRAEFTKLKRRRDELKPILGITI